MRNGLRVVTSIGVMTKDVVTKRIGRDYVMGSLDTSQNTSRKQLEVVEHGAL
jgi:hypothetical protein